MGGGGGQSGGNGDICNSVNNEKEVDSSSYKISYEDVMCHNMGN